MPEVGGEVARYFEPGDVDDLARALLELLEDQELQARLGREGLARSAEFSSVRMAERTAQAYLQVTD